MTTVKKQYIQWTYDESMLVFRSIENYLLGINIFPPSSNIELFQKFQSELPPHRRKKLGTYSSVNVLKNQYFEYKIKKDKQEKDILENAVKIKMPSKPLKEVLTDLPDNISYPKLNDITIDTFANLLDAKFVLLYKSISDLIEDSNKKLPQLVIDAILSKDTGSKEEVKVSVNTPVSEVKVPEPVVKVMVEKPHFVKTTILDDNNNPFDSQSVSFVPDSNNISSRMFTEAEIRQIVREEIESIFGPIKSDPKPEKEITVHTEPVISPKKTLEVLVGDKYQTVDIVEVQKEPKTIYIYGLDASKFQNIKKYFNDRKYLTIDGSEYLNHDVKHKAKNTDLIIVTKFSSHAVVESLKTSCDLSKIEFVQGGLTSIKNKIKLFLGELE